MKFKDILNEIKAMTSTTGSKRNRVIQDPKKYPKNDMYGQDTGITDRTPAGFTSDVNTLKRKSVMGRSSERTHIKYKDYKIVKKHRR